jgi:hypothetical protein
MLPAPCAHGADTVTGVGPGIPRQAGFQRVKGPLHALSHLARGAGPGRGSHAEKGPVKACQGVCQ